MSIVAISGTRTGAEWGPISTGIGSFTIRSPEFDLAAVAARHPEWDVFRQLSPLFSIDNAHHLERSFTRVLEEATVALNYQSAALRLALDMLVLDVMRTVSQPIDARSSIARHPAVLRAIHLLETRFREPWTLNEIAAHVGISRAHLAKLFQQDTGIPLHKFLNRARISRAEHLLRNSELSCESIAVECGFGSIQHFSRAFKIHTGMTPMQCRAGRSATAESREVGRSVPDRRNPSGCHCFFRG